MENQGRARGWANSIGRGIIETGRGSPIGGPPQLLGRAATVSQGLVLSHGLINNPENADRTRGRPNFDYVLTRPAFVQASKTGTSGKSINLHANYFQLLMDKSAWEISLYHIGFQPDIDSTIERKRLFRQHSKKFEAFVFDGASLLTNKRLEKDTDVWVTQHEGSGEVFEVTCNYVKKVFVTDQQGNQMLNLMLRKAMEGLKLNLVGRNFFDAMAKIGVPEHHLELWPGYITSIRQHEKDIMMCAEITTKVMRLETALEVFKDCIRHCQDFKQAFAKEIIGITVLTGYNNKTYRVDDIDWESSPTSTFEGKNGEKIRYVDYYARRYNIRIVDMKQPLLISCSKDKDARGKSAGLISLIPELCRLTGLTDDMRSNNRLMRALADHTRVGPQMRISRLNAFNERLQKSENSLKMLNEWNLKLDNNLIQFSGRELAAESILFDNKECPGSSKADWSRDLRDASMYTKIGFNNWHVVTEDRNLRETKNFLSLLFTAARGLEINIKEPQMMVVKSDRTEEIATTIDNCIREDSQFIMVILSNNNSQRYGVVKKKCYVENAIPTQVIVLKTIKPRDGSNRGLMSVATKIAIQMHCKMGAIPWFIKMPLSGLMMVGFDVSHDTKNKQISYGALVATMDQRKSGRYFTAVSPHKNSEEVGKEMCGNLQKALAQFKREHQTLPSKIIFYRDGVGEGQIQAVRESEVQHMKMMLLKEYGDVESIRFTFVIVNKRINTRIFKQGTNPLPGTIVDTCITQPERYDFFLVPQNVNQGTVTPTYYNVIEDTLMLPPDKLQILTFKACHLYYNWSGTIRVPAVCQYAHKCSFLVGQTIHQVPNAALSNKLYFL